MARRRRPPLGPEHELVAELDLDEGLHKTDPKPLVESP